MIFGSGRSTREGIATHSSILGIPKNPKWGFLGSNGKESTCNAGDLGLIPGLRRYPGEGNSYPLHYSGLENSMNRGAWQATVHGFSELDMTDQLSFMLPKFFNNVF